MKHTGRHSITFMRVFQSLLPENADQSTFQRLTQKGKWFFDLYFLCNNWLVFIIGLIDSVNVILFLSSETEKVQFAPLKMPDTGAVSFVLLKTKISPLCSSFRTLFLYYGDFRIVFVLRTVVYVLSSLSKANIRRSVPPCMICQKLTFFTFIFTSPY